MIRKQGIFAIFLGLAASGCLGESESPLVELTVPPAEGSEATDRYIEIDRLALVGVKHDQAVRALAGDAALAQEIGSRFAELRRTSEARLWFQVSAENGDAAGMSQMSVLMRDSNCHRANFWLERSLDFGKFSAQTKESMRQALSSYRKTCI